MAASVVECTEVVVLPQICIDQHVHSGRLMCWCLSDDRQREVPAGVVVLQHKRQAERVLLQGIA
jgi:hypothetical protein